MVVVRFVTIFFFFNDTATTEIYTLSLHDALPICVRRRALFRRQHPCRGPEGRLRRLRHARGRKVRRRALGRGGDRGAGHRWRDRKSTRLNSSHANISYAVFCLKKKKNPKMSDEVY